MNEWNGWNEVCPMCGRRSMTIYPSGMGRCNRCWTCSSKFDRWLARYEKVIHWVTIGIVLFAAGIAWGLVRADDVRITTIKAGEIEWITGRVGDDTVNLLRNSAGDASWTTGTIGDDSVNLLENRVDSDGSWTTGTIGDDDVSISTWSWDDDGDDDDD